MKSTQVFKLKGGTGNQLFIYFAGLSYQIETGNPVKFETSALRAAKTAREISLNAFKLPVPPEYLSHSKTTAIFLRIVSRCQRTFRLELKNSFFLPTEVGYSAELMSIKPMRFYVDGYFQTWKYLSKIVNYYPDWWPRLVHESESFKQYSKLLKEESPIVIHIRRGDYLEHEKTFGVLPELYFYDSIKILSGADSQNNIWVFSDDPNYVKKSMPSLNGSRFPELEADFSNEEILILMSQAKRLVISNSTFSWWAAAWSDPSAKIIAPDPWFRNLPTPKCLYPENWITKEPHWNKKT